MGMVVEMTSGRSWSKQWIHKLTNCPTFWGSFLPRNRDKYKCSQCGRKIRCYWDGNDTCGHIDVCTPCAKVLESEAADNKCTGLPCTCGDFSQRGNG